LEKTFAKRYGNWEHTVGGWMYAAVAALNGSPWRNTSHGAKTDDEIWSLIKSHDIDTDVMTSATYFCGSDSDQNDDGLACSHAYTVIGHYETSRGDRLIKVRNPWGSEQYHGPWSKDDSIWNDNPDLRQEIEDAMGDANTNNEGIFYMDVKSYRENFQLSCINEDTSNWDFDYFLMLGDQSSSSNTKHTINIKNTGPTQKVHVGGHVW